MKYIFTLTLSNDRGYDGVIEDSPLISSRDNNKLKSIKDFLLKELNKENPSKKILKYLSQSQISSYKFNKDGCSFFIKRTRVI